MPPTEFTESNATRKLAALIACISTSGSAAICRTCSSNQSRSSKLPKSSTSAKQKSSSEARFSTSCPSLSDRNSPSWLSSLSAFQFIGLWLAVMIIPPCAPSPVTAISVVGVVARPISVTSHPHDRRVPLTTRSSAPPERRASRPITIRGRLTPVLSLMKAA